MTLIEVLVALAILGIAAVGLAATHGNLLLAREQMRRLDAEDEALRRAREAVLAADATGTAPTVGKEGRRLAGRVELSAGGFAEWEAELRPAGIGDLFEVALTVRREGEAGDGLAQSFHLLRPGWSDETDRRALLDAARERLRVSRSFEGTIGGQATGGTSRGSGRGRGEGGGRGRPGEGSGRPGEGMGRPGEGSGRPGDGMARPGEGMGRPGEGAARPGAGSEAPRGGARPGGGSR